MKNDYQVIYRTNGIVEQSCSHGIGHPIIIPKALQGHKKGFEVHGCDGCCYTGEFKRVEKKNRTIILRAKKF